MMKLVFQVIAAWGCVAAIMWGWMNHGYLAFILAAAVAAWAAKEAK